MCTHIRVGGCTHRWSIANLEYMCVGMGNSKYLYIRVILKKKSSIFPGSNPLETGSFDNNTISSLIFASNIETFAGDHKQITILRVQLVTFYLLYF